jgi:hypothetical protein
MQNAILNIDVADDYRPSDGEIDNIVYLVCKYTVGWGMRQCDLAVCRMMTEAQGGIVGKQGISNLVMVTADYVWDHICGEPDEVSPTAFFEHMRPMLEAWYSDTSPAQRADTGDAN